MPHLNKPLSEFLALDKKLSQQGTWFSLSAGETFQIPYCALNDATIIFRQGSAMLYRSNSPIMYGVVHSPVIFGLAAAVNKINNEYVLIAETDCRGYFLPARETLVYIERYQLWREAFYWMTWQTRMLEQRDNQLIGTNHYHQIRATLLMMMSWDSDFRMRIGVLNYIQRRTNISRSVIAEILSALRKGDYITMEKGKLVGITRLPHDY